MNRDNSADKDEAAPAAAQRLDLTSSQLTDLRRVTGYLCARRTPQAAEDFLAAADMVRDAMKPAKSGER